jgi:hypothetical protein
VKDYSGGGLEMKVKLVVDVALQECRLAHTTVVHTTCAVVRALESKKWR